MNYTIYKVIGKHKDTKRKRSLSIPAKSEASAEQVAMSEGLLPPFQTTIIPHPLPSDRQLDYAKGAGINIPLDATAEDVSCLLSRYEKNDSDPNPGLIEFAENRGFFFSKYIGKRSLYDLVFYELKDVDKTAFFVFSIYRWLSDDRYANLDTHPNKELFYAFAQQVSNDSTFQKSLMSYSGSDLRYFGTITNERNGWVSTHSAGSNQTIAYKKAATYIGEIFGTKLTKNMTINNDEFTDSANTGTSKLKHSKPTSGCLSLILGILLVLTLLFLV